MSVLYSRTFVLETGHLLVKMVRWSDAASVLEPGKPNVLSLDDVLQSMHMPHTITLRDRSPDRPVNPYWDGVPLFGRREEVCLSLKMSGEALEFDSRPRLGSLNVPSSRPTSMIDERLNAGKNRRSIHGYVNAN